jgi:hypothetical protein
MLKIDNPSEHKDMSSYIVSKKATLLNYVIAAELSLTKWKLNTPKMVADRTPDCVTCKGAGAMTNKPAICYYFG